MRLMSFCRDRKNAATTTDTSPKPIIRFAREPGLERAVHQHLAAHHGVQRDVEQQPG